MALPLLFACLDPTLSANLPLTISSRIQQAYAEIRVLDVAVNPVTRVHLDIGRNQDRLCISEVELLRDDAGELVAVGNGGGSNVQQQQQQHTNTILLQMQQMKAQIVT